MTSDVTDQPSSNVTSPLPAPNYRVCRQGDIRGRRLALSVPTTVIARASAANEVQIAERLPLWCSLSPPPSNRLSSGGGGVGSSRGVARGGGGSYDGVAMTLGD